VLTLSVAEHQILCSLKGDSRSLAGAAPSHARSGRPPSRPGRYTAHPLSAPSFPDLPAGLRRLNSSCRFPPGMLLSAISATTPPEASWPTPRSRSVSSAASPTPLLLIPSARGTARLIPEPPPGDLDGHGPHKAVTCLVDPPLLVLIPALIRSKAVLAPPFTWPQGSGRWDPDHPTPLSPSPSYPS
jgi:hypothetical protein